MNNNLVKRFKDNNGKLIETIKLLIYKENKDIFNKVHFDNDNLFLEPLLFSYFNLQKECNKELLDELVQGYYNIEDDLRIKYSYNKSGIAYIPNKGYFKKNQKNKFLKLQKIFDMEIEVLKYSHPLVELILNKATINSENNDTNFIMDDQIFDSNIGFLTNALSFIKSTSKNYFDLIEQACKKCVLFKTNPSNTNSFATINAHGMAFFNVYQDNYDEVYFVDDISHQTGHIILTTILFERKKYFLIDETVNIGTITKKETEYRDFYTLFHALFTYYTSLLCLDNCIKGNCFDARQIHEAQGRIGFYIKKLISDINNFEMVVNQYKGIEFILTEEGIEIYNMMKNKFSEIICKWHEKTKTFEFANQSYNFAYKEFNKLNQNIDD